MRLREAVATKAFDLTKKLIGKVRAVSPMQHATFELIFECQKFAISAPVSNGAPKGVCLSTAEAGSNHGESDDLLLKDRDT